MRAYSSSTLSRNAEMWRLWSKGLSLEDIGKALDKPASSIYMAAASFGGIRPEVRRRAAATLSLAEREEISRGVASSLSAQRIARILGRATSTISREIARNGGRQAYRAEAADRAAWVRACRPKQCKLRRLPRLRLEVARKLQLQWSPQQISRWLQKKHPHEPDLHVSHETIYQTLFVQARGAFRKELTEHLRRCGYIRRARKLQAAHIGGLVDAISIRERPAEVADRAVPGHWEGDLIAGGRNTYIATLVERHSRFVILIKVETKDSIAFAAALARKIKRLPSELRRSLTWDRGTEMAAHKRFTVATDVKVYFCDPRSPWQRGSNENTNGLLRQYFAKGDDLSIYSQEYLNKIAARLNGRPRETLNWSTPAEVLAASVATTP
jgi:transposase, IS30 family